MVSRNDYDSAHARYYDYFSHGLAGDATFYVEEAVKAGSPVLELGCGTGRVTIPVAQAGVEIVGLDLSESMLAVAKEKVASLGGETRKRIEFAHGDMGSFYLNRRFKLAIIPYRSFIHLLTPDDQRQALHRIRDHLEGGGRLAFNVFDPRLDWIVDEHHFPEAPLRKHNEFINPETGNRVIVWAARQYDLERQLMKEDRIFEEVDA
ncbi:MAG: class I SAM-dependent methyltransferase, partial [Chloroflexi bacterium]|nr:class I SAM-dependent methyltransferase [Chloroflexota bacterium]